jgi:fluoroacetyl-CoA thioesterase
MAKDSEPLALGSFTMRVEDGELSVGVVVNVQHLAATPPGVDITAHARYLGRAGKLYRFEVTATEATDPGGEVGRGEHQRAIIKRERLLAGAAKRRGAE